METNSLMEKKDQPSPESFEFDDEEIIDLTETLQADDIIDLDTPTESFEDDDEFYDLDDFLSEKGGLSEDDEIIELVQEFDSEQYDDETIDLVQSADLDYYGDDETIDLLVPLEDASVIDLVDSADMTSAIDEESSVASYWPDEEFPEQTEQITQILDEDVTIDLLDSLEDNGEEADLDLTQTLDVGIDLTQTLSDIELDDDILELTDQVVSDYEDDTIELTEKVNDNILSDHDGDDETIELDQTVSMEDFAEQTTENLQFDTDGSSDHTVIDSEPVTDTFEFDSFAEQTQKDFAPVSRVDADIHDDGKEFTSEDIEEEIRNLKTDITDSDDIVESEATELIEPEPELFDSFSDDLEEKNITDECEDLFIDISDGRISQAALDLSLERVVRKLYSEKLDEIFRDVVEKAITGDIERIREALKK